EHNNEENMIQCQLRLVSRPSVKKAGEVKKTGGEGPKVGREEWRNESWVVDVVVRRSSREPLPDVRKTMITVQDPCKIIFIRRIGSVKAHASQEDEQRERGKE